MITGQVSFRMIQLTSVGFRHLAEPHLSTGFAFSYLRIDHHIGAFLVISIASSCTNQRAKTADQLAARNCLLLESAVCMVQLFSSLSSHALGQGRGEGAMIDDDCDRGRREHHLNRHF